MSIDYETKNHSKQVKFLTEQGFIEYILDQFEQSLLSINETELTKKMNEKKLFRSNIWNKEFAKWFLKNTSRRDKQQFLRGIVSGQEGMFIYTTPGIDYPEYSLIIVCSNLRWKIKEFNLELYTFAGNSEGYRDLVFNESLKIYNKLFLGFNSLERFLEIYKKDYNILVFDGAPKVSHNGLIYPFPETVLYNNRRILVFSQERCRCVITKDFYNELVPDLLNDEVENWSLVYVHYRKVKYSEFKLHEVVFSIHDRDRRKLDDLRLALKNLLT